jgi:hypothetical protein
MEISSKTKNSKIIQINKNTLQFRGQKSKEIENIFDSIHSNDFAIISIIYILINLFRERKILHIKTQRRHN